MLSTIRPIIIPLSGLEDAAGTYLMYEVRMLYNDNSTGGTAAKTIYHGKSFVDAYGNTDIQIEKVLRDYLFRWRCRFHPDSQQYRPECLIGSLSQQLYAIEAANDLFWNTTIEIAYTYNSTEQVETIDVSGAWCPPFQSMGAICSSLEDVAITDYVQNYAVLSTPVPPHIPPIATSKFWLGLVLNINKGAEANVGSIAIGATSVDNIAINYRHGGTYALAVTLAQLFADLSSNDIDGGTATTTDYYDDIDGGNSASTYSGSYDGGTSEDSGYTSDSVFAGLGLSLFWYVAGNLYRQIAAVVDNCAKPFYVSWITPTGGWTAYGFSGNVTKGITDEQTSIVNILGDTDVLANKEQNTFNLYSGRVNKETYAHLMTMLQSRILYVYDTARDMGWYCTAATNNATTIPSVTGKSQTFQIQLKSINANEQ